MSGRKLTPEDPRWWRVEKALEHHRQQTDSVVLTMQDFNRVLIADRLRAMVRRADGSCDWLPASAWSDFHIAPLILVDTKSFDELGRSRMRPGKLVVWSRQLGGQIQGQWVFVWRPDYEKIFPSAATPPAKPRAQSAEVTENRGRKPVHDRADLQSAALGLALLRKHGAPEKIQAEVVSELRDWCKQDKRKVPGDTYLQDIVRAAFRIKRTLKN